jgi:phytoene dehydrogenase-like protein
LEFLEQRYFTGLRNQIEVIDVPTLITWERYMGGTHGFANMPNKKISFLSAVFGKGQEMTLPGLSGFYMAGVWVISAGALFMNALSGRKVIQTICRGDKREFAVPD